MAKTLGELITDLETQLVPKGSEDLIRLQLRNHGFVQGSLVRESIEQFKNSASTTMVLGAGFTPLERLGLLLLLGSLEKET